MLEGASSKYRLDIDGLRALAVIAVVLYHAESPGVPGGFAGVDIFFVISGFLITRILYADLERTGRLRIADFYARRIRRILPSLVVVTAAALAAGCMLLSASLFELHDLAKSAIAVMLFSANFYYLSQDNYFAAASESMPLLHCWSLAIEEQYYLLWPLVLMAAHRFGRRLGRPRQICAAVVTLLSAGSLVMCAAAMDCCSVAAFYLPTTRIWELGVGSALGLVDSRRFAASARWSGAASILGLGSISASFLFLHDFDGFPFPWALLPVVGSALVLWGGAGAPDGPVGRLLTIRPMVSIGRVSYAWYLVHWPLLSFAHILTLGEASPALRGGLVAASLALAYLTTWFVERPARFGYGAALSTRHTVASGALAAGIVIVASGAAYLAARSGVLESQPRIAAAYRDRPARQSLCLLDGKSGGGRLESACVNPDETGLAIWGDSLAGQWSPTFERIAESRGDKGPIDQLTMAACPPLIDLVPTDPSGRASTPFRACRDFNAAVLQHLVGMPRASRRTVLLAANWAARATPAAIAGASPARQFFDVRARTMDDSLGYLETALDATLSRLTDAGFAVLVVLQSPSQPHSAPACDARLGPDLCFTTLARHLDRAGPVNAVLRRVAMRHERVGVFDPVEILCEGARCPGRIGDRIAYYDELHMSASFASSDLTASALAKSLQALQAQQAQQAQAPYGRIRASAN
jgi:peptidoglycan/LPS O-acetylase OafA/YrhL